MFAYRMLDNNELKEELRRRFLPIHISRIQCNSIRMSVWLSPNRSFVVYQDMFVDSWTELAPSFGLKIGVEIIFWRCCFEKTNLKSTTSYISILNVESFPGSHF